MRLRGTLYFRTSFTSPWSVKVPAYEDVARFHFAHFGRCFVRIEGVPDPVALAQGDLVIITRGASHTLYCDPTTEDQALLLDRVVEQSGFDGSGALVYGEPGTDQETQLVCGHFAFESTVKHPLIESLPPFIHIRNYGEAAGDLMENTLKVIGAEAGRQQMGGDLIALKLSEIVFAQALRTYLNSGDADDTALAGFAHRGLARALQAIHADPAAPWSLESLSQIAGMSRTSFSTKFSALMSMTPLAYVTYWRMQIARQELADSDRAIISIAEYIGYQSEASFGRAFKKAFDTAPAAYRRMMRRDTG